jgi:hypothetical protein
MALGTILIFVSLILLSISEYYRRRTYSRDLVLSTEKELTKPIKINKD